MTRTILSIVSKKIRNFENKKLMTEKRRLQIIGLVYSVIGGVLVGVSMLMITSFADDRDTIKKEINRLDKSKADVSYVDKKVETIEQKLDKINDKQDKILEIIIEMK